jgi:hypothetical protein
MIEAIASQTRGSDSNEPARPGPAMCTKPRDDACSASSDLAESWSAASSSWWPVAAIASARRRRSATENHSFGVSLRPITHSVRSRRAFGLNEFDSHSSHQVFESGGVSSSGFQRRERAGGLVGGPGRVSASWRAQARYPRPRSSGDRAPASGAGGVGSNPTEGALPQSGG